MATSNSWNWCSPRGRTPWLWQLHEASSSSNPRFSRITKQERIAPVRAKLLDREHHCIRANARHAHAAEAIADPQRLLRISLVERVRYQGHRPARLVDDRHEQPEVEEIRAQVGGGEQRDERIPSPVTVVLVDFAHHRRGDNRVLLRPLRDG